MVQLSICMMVKDEAPNLRRCLDSLSNLRKNISNELIIIDTGSVDETVEIAKEYTKQVYFHKWNNHFSEMRNKSISYANGKWLLIIDADEELVDDKGIIAFLNNNKNSNIYVAAMIKLSNVFNSEGAISSSIKTVRLFKNDGKDKYEGTVHNTPVIFGNVLEISGLIMHYGYKVDDKELMDRKFERTSKLLLLELEKNPLNVYYRYQLATSYDMHDDLELSNFTYERAYNDFKVNKLDPVEYHYIMAPYVKVLVSCKNYSRALEIALEGLLTEPDNIDLIYFGAIAYMFLKELDKGISLFTRYLEKLKIFDTLPISINPSIQLFTLNSENECYYNLAQAYLLKEDWDNVIYYSKKVMDGSDENSEYFNVALNSVVRASILTEKGELLLGLYEKYPEDRWIGIDNIVYATSKDYSINNESKPNIFEYLRKLPSKLGLVYTLRMENNDSLKFEKINKIEKDLFLLIQQGCDEALYLTLESEIDLSNLLLSCDELLIMKMVSALNEKYCEFGNLVEHYLTKISNEESYLVINLKRILLKYLALTAFGEKNAINKFGSYLEIGMNSLKSKYKEEFLYVADIQNLKNSEEQFLLCVWKIKNEKNVDRDTLFKQAVSCFPEWENSLYLWLEKEFSMNSSDQNKEFEKLLHELNKQVNYLINEKNYKSALNIVNDYLLIKSDDVGMLKLKSELVEKVLVH